MKNSKVENNQLTSIFLVGIHCFRSIEKVNINTNNDLQNFRKL